MNKKIISAVFFITRDTRRAIYRISFAIIIGAAVLYSAYFLFGDYYRSWRIGRDYQKFENAMEKFFREDVYGGATPEETYKMFVEALRAGDTDSAGKYFYWEYQERERKRFQQMKDEGKLEEYVNNLPDWGGMREEEYWDKDGKRLSWTKVSRESMVVKLPKGDGAFIEETIEPGEYKQEVIFQLNKQANIWKIFSL